MSQIGRARSSIYGPAISLAAAALYAVPLAARPPNALIRVPQGTVAEALASVARQANVSIGYIGRLPQQRIKGQSFTNAAAALTHIAQEAGLVVHLVGPDRYRLDRPARDAQQHATMPAQGLNTGDRPSVAQQDIVPEIVVTGTKRTEALSKLPLSISVITPDALYHGHALPNTVDAIANVSSVTSTNMGPGRNRIFIRGVADSAFNGPTQSTIGLYLGEARLNFDSPDPDLRLVDIQRVEIVKGPQGPLYGSGVLGGVYRIIPNTPNVAAGSGFVETALGATDHGGINIAASGMINAPVSDRLALRGVAYAERSSGWIDDPLRHRTDINAVHVEGGRLATQWTPGTTTVDAIFAGQWTDAADSQYATANQGPYARATRFAEPHHSNLISGQIRITQPIGDLEAVFSSTLVDRGMANNFDATDAAAQLGVVMPAEDASLRYQEERGQTLLTNELRLTRQQGRLQWLFGALQLSNRSTLRWALDGGLDAPPANDYRKSYHEFALFGDATFRVTPHLRLHAGGRVFQVINEELHSQSPKVERKSNWRANPSLALSWEVGSASQIWLRWADATRPGGLNPAATQAPFTFAADQLSSLELGGRTTGLEDRLTLEAAAYQLNWRNIQSDILLSSGLIGTLNVGHAQNYGAEVSARWTEPHWLVAVAATAQLGELDSATSLIGQIPDARLPTVPKLRGHIRIEADLPGVAASVRGGVTLQLNGPAHLSFDPQLDRTTSPYALVGAFARWAWQGLDFALVGDNLFNTKADSFAFGNPFSVRSTGQRTPLRPRTITLSVRRSF